MIDSEALGVTRQVTAVFEALGVAYVIGGSLASMVHGMMRTTMDADIIADLLPGHAAALVAALGEAFYVPDEALLRQAIERRGSFNLIHLATMFKVDIFVPQARPFDRQQLARRIGERVASGSDERLWVLSAEDVILAKLEWFRLGGETSERQWRDVLGVVRAQGAALDVAYLRQWGGALRVDDLVARALAAAEGQDPLPGPLPGRGGKTLSPTLSRRARGPQRWSVGQQPQAALTL